MTTASIHKKLANRRKKHDETLLQYSVAMREIAAYGQLEEVDVIAYIVDGVARDKNERLFLSGARTYNELRLLLHRYQDMLINSTDRPTMGGSTNISLINNNRKYNHYSKNKSQNENINVDVASRSKLPKCFNCNVVGHYAAACDKPKRVRQSCFKCGREAHVQGHCPLLKPIIKKEIVNVDTTVNDEKYSFIETVSLFLSNKVSKTSIKLKVRMDTASPISFIQERFVPPEFLESICRVSGWHVSLNSSPMNELGVLKVSILFRNRLTENNVITIVKDGTMRSAAIIGRDLMKRVGLRLVFKDELKGDSEPIFSIGNVNELNKTVSEIMSIEIRRRFNLI